MRKIIPKILSLPIPLSLLALACVAQTVSTIPDGVARYESAMKALMDNPGHVSLEKTFEECLQTAEALQRELERFDESIFQKIKRMMTGFWVNRMEVIVVDPDPSFFLKLANEKGTKSDKAFFEALVKTYPDPKSWWPAYKKPSTDYSGCTIFDGQTVSAIYDSWISFQKAYPKKYPIGAQKELSKVQDALEGNCVCGDEDGYRRAQESFMKTHPASPLVPKIASRLNALKNHASDMRFHCMPQ